MILDENHLYQCWPQSPTSSAANLKWVEWEFWSDVNTGSASWPKIWYNFMVSHALWWFYHDDVLEGNDDWQWWVYDIRQGGSAGRTWQKEADGQWSSRFPHSLWRGVMKRIYFPLLNARSHSKAAFNGYNCKTFGNSHLSLAHKLMFCS